MSVLLRVHDTMERRAVPFTATDPSRVTMYTCGPTVYDDAHIGNFRSFLFADVFRRFLESPFCSIMSAEGVEHQGPRRVVQVMNITDVGHMTEDDAADGGGEDKMEAAGRRLAEAKKSGKLPEGVSADLDPRDPFGIASFYAGRFCDDARRLGLRVVADAEADPSLMPRATERVGGMVSMIGSLIEKGSAYVVGEPGGRAVYFSVNAFAPYGRLSGNTPDRVLSGAGGRVTESAQAGKKHPADFLLWKEDPRHLMKWQSPWGEGYPGWHIECSTMALERLGGETGEIDLHTGGEDNIFPHHECEIAQSCCHTGRDRFSRHWAHARFLQVEGEKMSKSRGNFFTARQLFEKGHQPAAVRLEIIRAHYRTNANFTEQGLIDSGRQVDRWRAFAERAAQGGGNGEGDDGGAGAARREAAAAAFAAAMADDLNISDALAALNLWMKEVERPTPADGELLFAIDGVLGVLTLPRLESASTSAAVYLPGAAPDPRVDALIEQRAEARANKDWTRADAIRAELGELGYAVKDVAGGKVEVAPLRG